jgi:hypothetical protein
LTTGNSAANESPKNVVSAFIRARDLQRTNVSVSV